MFPEIESFAKKTNRCRPAAQPLFGIIDSIESFIFRIVHPDDVLDAASRTAHLITPFRVAYSSMNHSICAALCCHLSLGFKRLGSWDTMETPAS